ncbi:hypothetical protein AAF712_010932 [Marasmius tenuissimus]|uniref:Uncharacterized protein n=1 Tax=Marasmius tenuissimus TaxID=585030 RepID=A0ABR2ZKI7_9AGAR
MPNSSSRTQAQPARNRGSASGAPTTPPPSSPIVPPVRRKPCEVAAEKKRKECEAALKDLRKTKKPKPKTTQQPKEKEVKDLLEEVSKYYKRCIDAYLPLHMVVFQGMKSESRDDEDWCNFIKELPDPLAAPPPEPDEEPQVTNERPQDNDQPMEQDQGHSEEVSEEEETMQTPEELKAQLLKAWAKLKEKSSAFLTFANFCAVHQEPKDFTDMAYAMTRVADQCLYDDNHTLKNAMDKLVSPNIFTGASCVQTFQKGSKADRGVKNDVLLELQLHWDDIPEYRDGDAETRNILKQYRMEDGRDLTADDMSAFMYDISQVNVPPDDAPQDVGDDDEEIEYFESGFLMSHFLTRESPAAKNKHVDNARAMNMLCVTPEYMMWVMNRVRFAICDLERWGSDDKEFSFVHSYYNTLDMYKRLDLKQRKEILAFWNQENFGNPKGRIEKSLRSSKPKEGSNVDKFHKRRDRIDAAKKAAAEKAAAEKAAAEKAAAEQAAAEEAAAAAAAAHGGGDGN